MNDLVVPIDFITTDAAQVAWIAGEWTRARHADRRLTLEFDGAALVESAQAARMLARLQAQGLRLAAHLPNATHLAQLLRLPLHLARIPAAALLSLPADVLDPILGAWSQGGRALVIDEMHDLNSVARLWSLGVDYLMGDAMAAAGPRLDFDFSEINLI